MRLVRFQLLGVVLASALGLLGCQQGIGGRCVQDSDCSSGHCSITGESAQGGVCQASSTLPPPTGTGGSMTDAGGVGGAGGQDGATDAPVTDASGIGGSGGTSSRDGATDAQTD